MYSMIAFRVRSPTSTTVTGVLKLFLGLLRESRKDRHMDIPTKLGYTLMEGIY